MDTERLLDAMTPEAYEKLTYAVETGRCLMALSCLKNNEILVCKL